MKYSLLIALACALAGRALAGDAPATPLERAGYTRISSSAEISAYLDALDAGSEAARKEVVGTSVQGRPIEALLLSRSAEAAAPAARMTIMIVGSQHGAAEPAGGEALLVIARSLLNGKLQPLLDDVDVVLLPNANPDGRDLGQRSNAERVNLNTDFVLVSQPETRVLKLALDRYQPEAILDAHESAVLKRQTLAREGYLTDFDAQFDIANNSAVPAALRDHALASLLPDLTARVSAGGLPAHRYIGEITSTRQPITNGGLTLRNFRNTGGMSGAFSFLVETKLDSRDDPFPTYRNIKGRVERQLICLESFLELIHAQRADLLARVGQARAALLKEPVTLYAGYVEDPDHPEVGIPLRRIDTRELEEHAFPDHRRVTTADTIPMPATYVVTEHVDEIRAVLDRHGILYEQLSTPLEVPVTIERFSVQAGIATRAELLKSAQGYIRADSGALLLDLVQRHGRLVPLLLDPRSTSSIFRYPAHAGMVRADRDAAVYRVVKGMAQRARPEP